MAINTTAHKVAKSDVGKEKSFPCLHVVDLALSPQKELVYPCRNVSIITRIAEVFIYQKVGVILN